MRESLQAFIMWSVVLYLVKLYLKPEIHKVCKFEIITVFNGSIKYSNKINICDYFSISMSLVKKYTTFYATFYKTDTSAFLNRNLL